MKIKRFAFLSLIGLLLPLTIAAEDYAVYAWSGTVSYADAPERAVRRNDTLQTTDCFQMGRNASVTLKELATGRLYSCRTENARSACVKQIVRQRSDNSVFAVVKEVLSETTKGRKAKAKKTEFKMRGSGVRGGGHDNFYTSLLRASAELADTLCTGRWPRPTQLFTLVQHNDTDGCTFSIENRSKRPYIVNILAVDRTTCKASMCITFPAGMSEPYLVSEPGTRMRLDDFRFATDNPSVRYLLIATEDAYDAAVLDGLLSLPLYEEQDIPYKKYLTSRPHREQRKQ